MLQAGTPYRIMGSNGKPELSKKSTLQRMLDLERVNKVRLPISKEANMPLVRSILGLG
jgi:hypothetical protein